MRPLLESISPFQKLPEWLVPTIESAGRGSKVGADVKLLALLGGSIETECLVLATDHPVTAITYLPRLKDNVRTIEFWSSEIADAVHASEAASGRSVVSRGGGGGACTMVIDALGLDRSIDEVCERLRSGDVRFVHLAESLLSVCRSMELDLERQGVEIDRVPLSHGLTVIRWEPRFADAIEVALRTIASESPWHPSRISKHDAEDPDASPLPIDRVGTCLDGIDDALDQALEGLPARPADRPDDVPMRIAEFFRQEGRRGDLLRAIVCEEADRSLKFAEKLGAQEAGTPGAIKSLAMLFDSLYRVREMAWWARHWDIGTSKTWQVILEKDVSERAMVPKPVKPLSEYMDYYWLEGQMTFNVKEEVRQSGGEGKLDRRMAPHKSKLNHSFRILNAASLCGFLVSRLAYRYPGETIRWLDIGTGKGTIPNAAEIDPAVLDRVDIIGLDFGESRVSIANALAAKNRRYIRADGLETPEELRGTKIHLITAFELLEHIFDPVELLQKYMVLQPDLVAAGSPLGEGRSWRPQKAHVWGFQREGYEAVFKAAGMDITLSSEVRIGSYVGGHDWVTVVGTTGEKLA